MFKDSKTLFLGDEKKFPESFTRLKTLAKKQGITIETVQQLPEMSYFEEESANLLFFGDFYLGNKEALQNISDLAFLILFDNEDMVSTLDLEVFDVFINSNSKLENSIPILKTFTKLSKKLTTEKVSRLYERTSAKLESIKRIHEKVVPIRIEKTKNVSIFSKYAAGTSRGGDFFDISTNDNQITFLMSSTHSYITSTIITSYFEKIQNVDASKEKYEDILEDLINECRDHELINREKPDLLEIYLMAIDLKKLSYFGYQFGRFQCFSTNNKNDNPINEYPLNENFIEEGYFYGKLLPGEKLSILSPGVFKNLGKNFSEFKKIENNTSKNLLNNIFFNLKRENNFEDFLKFDSTVAVIEVNSNVLVQI